MSLVVDHYKEKEEEEYIRQVYQSCVIIPREQTSWLCWPVKSWQILTLYAKSRELLIDGFELPMKSIAAYIDAEDSLKAMNMKVK